MPHHLGNGLYFQLHMETGKEIPSVGHLGILFINPWRDE